jgi:hypothetical protein
LPSPISSTPSALVTERREQRDEPDDRVGRRPAEHARVHRARERIQPHVDARHPAQRRGERRHADREVARVDDEDGVGAEEVRVIRDERLEPAGPLLLGAVVMNASVGHVM